MPKHRTPMQQPVPIGSPNRASPSFYLIDRQPLRPEVLLLAVLAAACALCLIVYAMGRNGRAKHASGGAGAGRSAGAAAAASASDEDDDPSQIDTIVLGDPADAPVPGRKGEHVSPVHPTILISLPRYGEQTGLIPDTPAGHLLYGWLAAFNQASYPALGSALPNVAPAIAAAGQMELRRATGGFNLLSAKEVLPGVLVFRLRDQTPFSTEVLGTLQVRPSSSPAAIASFSLRSVPPPVQSSRSQQDAER